MDSFHADHSDICVAAVRGCGLPRPEAAASVMVKTAKKVSGNDGGEEERDQGDVAGSGARTGIVTFGRRSRCGVAMGIAGFWPWRITVRQL